MDYLPQQILNHKSIIPCIGLHPWYIVQGQLNDLSKMEELLMGNPQLQVGEIGLDFVKAKEKAQQQLQIQLFEQQIEYAFKFNRSMSVHCVRASGQLLKVFKQQFKQKPNYDQPIIMHSYNCPKEITQSLNKIYPHFYYSFSMNIANKLDALNDIEVEKLLFETDAPYQFNQKVLLEKADTLQSHPKYVIDLIKMASKHLGVDLSYQVMKNFKKAFKL